MNESHWFAQDFCRFVILMRKNVFVPKMCDLVLQQSHEATPDGLKVLFLLHGHRPHPIRPDETQRSDTGQSADSFTIQQIQNKADVLRIKTSTDTTYMLLHRSQMICKLVCHTKSPSTRLLSSYTTAIQKTHQHYFASNVTRSLYCSVIY